jgi:hypothetical protein
MGRKWKGDIGRDLASAARSKEKTGGRPNKAAKSWDRAAKIQRANESFGRIREKPGNNQAGKLERPPFRRAKGPKKGKKTQKRAFDCDSSTKTRLLQEKRPFPLENPHKKVK